MNDIPYKVIVIVDPAYGERLSELANDVPVWIVDTPINRAVAQRRWAESPQATHLTGVTTFNASDSVEDSLINELDVIDLHHGKYSAEPPYTGLEIIGVPATERIKAELSQYGFDEFHETITGVTAFRPLPQ